MVEITIEVDSLTVSYFGDIFVLQDVSLKADRGKITCIIGPNGAGKSTLLKAIFGFLKPKSGRILYNGKEVTTLEPHRKLKAGISFITQDRSVFPTMSVEENLELGAWTFRRDGARVRKELEAIYGRYPRLRERRNVKAGRMSGGEQRMLEVGRALMTNPTTILFDEPTAGLAPNIAKEIYSEIRKLGDEGKTILLVDQNIAQGLGVSDYVYVLELGCVKYQGTVDDVKGKLTEIVRSWVKI